MVSPQTKMIVSYITVPWTEYELVPVGVYEAEIIEVEEVDSPFRENEQLFQLHFRLNYQNSQGEPVVMKRLISEKLNAKSKLFELVGAFDGKKPSKESYPGGIDDSFLLGKKCKIVIRHTDSQTGNTWAKIDSFLPLDKKDKAGEENI